MELCFKQANLLSHQIVYASDGKKYIMDTSTMVGKAYYWGILKDKITIEMFEISQNNHLFELTSKPNLSTTTVVIAIQLLVKSIYDIVTDVFVNSGVSHQILLKIGLFFLSTLLAYPTAMFYLYSARKTLNKRLSNNRHRYIITFRTDGKRNYSWFVPLAINIILLICYLCDVTGSEWVFLILNSLMAFLLFMGWLVMPVISISYRNSQFIFESIQKAA